MSFLERKMFANGGFALLPMSNDLNSAIASNEVVVGDQSYKFDIPKLEQAVRDGTLDGMNLYPILDAPGAQRGSEIQRILNTFKKGDQPGIISSLGGSGDFGSNLQNIGLTGQRVGQSARNVGSYLGNRAAQGYGIVADALSSPTIKGLLGGSDAEIKRQEEIDAGFSYVPEEDPFGYTPLMTKDDVARIRLNQMGDLITSRDTIEQELGNLNVVDTASVEEVSVETPKELPTGTVEIRNIGPDYRFDPTKKLKLELEAIGKDEFGDDLLDPKLVAREEINRILDELRPAEVKVDVDKTEIDSIADIEEKFAGLSKDEIDALLEEEQIKLLKEKLGPVDKIKPIKPILSIPEAAAEKQKEQDGEQPPPPKDAITRKLDEPGFFGSDRFLDFIRNVGGELVETGQMDEGLSRGAAKAAEERAARELMADQEERDFASKLRLAQAEAALAGAGALEYSEAKTAVEMEDEIGTAIKNFDEDERILSDINQILNEDINAPGAFGAQGFFGKINDKFRNAIGMGETEWENLPAEVRTAKILEITAQRSVRSILGESGKTISNLDRDIVARIFGDVNIWTSPAELKKILGNSRSQIIGNLRTGQTLIISRGKALNLTGYPSSTLDLNRSVIERILKFNFDQAETYRIGDSAAGYTETSL